MCIAANRPTKYLVSGGRMRVDGSMMTPQAGCPATFRGRHHVSLGHIDRSRPRNPSAHGQKMTKGRWSDSPDRLADCVENRTRRGLVDGRRLKDGRRGAMRCWAPCSGCREAAERANWPARRTAGRVMLGELRAGDKERSVLAGRCRQLDIKKFRVKEGMEKENEWQTWHCSTTTARLKLREQA